MLKSVKELYGHSLGASDGEIGHVKDFYFDDQTWAVRYLVADTGSWLPGRQVLISPHAIGALDQAGKALPVNLTRKQIENSPPIESHKPVSRQYEEDFYRYYSLPFYWEGGDMWGMNPFPVSELPQTHPPGKRAAANGHSPARADAHLRSTLAVSGYHIQATDGIVGHICDFMINARSWAIGQLVVKIGHRFSGKEVLIPTNKVDRISYDESTVFVSLTKAAVEAIPGPAMAAANAPH